MVRVETCHTDTGGRQWLEPRWRWGSGAVDSGRIELVGPTPLPNRTPEWQWREGSSHPHSLLRPSDPTPAGFLRIRGAACVLDSTAVHPESYAAAERLVLEVCSDSGSSQAAKVAAAVAQALAAAANKGEGRPSKRQKTEGGSRQAAGAPAGASKRGGKAAAKSGGAAAATGSRLTAQAVLQARPALTALLRPGAAVELAAAAAQLGVGEPTLRDMVEALMHPEMRDVRGEGSLAALQFRQSLLLTDLREGMEVAGVVRNVGAGGAKGRGGGRGGVSCVVC